MKLDRGKVKIFFFYGIWISKSESGLSFKNDFYVFKNKVTRNCLYSIEFLGP